jgi:hypothetical protein
MAALLLHLQQPLVDYTCYELQVTERGRGLLLITSKMCPPSFETRSFELGIRTAMAEEGLPIRDIVGRFASLPRTTQPFDPLGSST